MRNSERNHVVIEYLTDAQNRNLIDNIGDQEMQQPAYNTIQ
jgi:hypothetical protein